MLKPAIAPRRVRGPSLGVTLAFVTGALIGVAGSLAGFLLAPQRVVVIEAKSRPATTSSLKATFSTRATDVIGPGAYGMNGTPDEVIDVELTSALAVQHIVVNGNGGSHQWDTVIGSATIPYGPVYAGNRGDVTWHLGVRENGQWHTDPRTGALRELAAGVHRLELIGDGVYDGPGPRNVTVVFVDGTTMTAVATD